MAFGISFGSKKEKGSSTTNVNKTETTDQTQTGTQTSTGLTQQSGTSATQTQGATTQTGTTTGSTTGSQTSTQQATQFSEPVLSSLESSVQALLGNLPTAPSQMEGSFNHDQFVQGGVDAASARIQGDLESSLNSIFDQFGGRDDSNSMATLLANRGRSDAAASIAGVRSQLEGQAQEIEKNRFLANLQGVGQQEGFLTQVLDALKGGRAATTGAVQTAEQTAGTSNQAGTTTGSETTQTAQTQLQQTIEQLLQQLQGTTTTVGTESTKSKGSSGGFGLGLSI
jgi:hypothetical protein